ncbi:MAG: hypothetical protein ACRDRX_13885 [Pseudonocardiaceae bacterium]
MLTATPRPTHDRWCDSEGTHLSLFSQVEQVDEASDSGVLFSRVGQRGVVVGRGRESLFVRFPDHVVLSVSPRVLRLLPEASAGEC